MMELKQLGKSLKNRLAVAKPNLTVKCRKIGDVKARVAVDAMETATSPAAFPFFQTESQQDYTPASKVQLCLLFYCFRIRF